MPAPAIAPFLPLIGTGVSVIGNMLGGIFGNKSRKKEAKRSRTHDINMWDKTNAYNHPSQQMARLRDAGLNPNLVYGGSSGGTAGTANALPGAKDPKINDITMGENPMMQYVGIKNTQAQTDNLRTQNGLYTAEKNLKEVQALTEMSKNKDFIQSAEYKKTLIQKTLQDIVKSISETNNLKKDGQMKDYQLERAKTGILPGDDYKKVILDILMDTLFNVQNGGFVQPLTPRKL